jgi:endoglycosylceramidase
MSTPLVGERQGSYRFAHAMRRLRARSTTASGIFAIALLASCGNSSAPAPSPATGVWHVSGGFIRDEAGRAVILRGVQVSGDQKATPYLDGETAADYQRIHDDWGFDSIRFLMVWAAIEPQKGQYDDAYLDALAERAGWAQAAGLSVVVDMHQDIYGEGFGYDGAPAWACDASNYAAFQPVTPWSLNALNPNVEACTDELYTSPDTLAHFTEAWRRVANRLAGIPSVIGFDPLNEPEWGSESIGGFEQDRLEPFYESVVKVVRGEAPNWLAFVEPASSRNLGYPTGLTPFTFANVVYAPHSYDTNAETKGAFPLEDAPSIVSNVAALAAEAKSLNAALWIGEYGGQWNDPNIGAYVGAQYQGIGAVAGGSDLWDRSAGGGYSLVAADGTERPALANAVALPYPARVAGDPISYAFDPSTSTFTLVYAPDRAVTAPTEIVVPSRVYAHGYRVDCGSCVSRTTATGVTIDTPDDAAPATITLSPSG